ncbi:phospholipid carrier-dependent glycosyltransferase [Cellulosimicrobium sp. SH8]|uniref:phospholipid carrier-dependent glycosyltransferase n=1 Tax=Cellulosimicrobium sp. SH8 TaxID=2952936 RepID=UPI0021F34065|nr:phospholipid carrier-dependent glycosyltransferase [Cellulosimicrobium sp. SH8]
MASVSQPPADAHPGPRPASDATDDRSDDAGTRPPPDVEASDLSDDSATESPGETPSERADETAGSEPDAASDLTHRERLLLALLGPRRLALGATAHDRLWGWLGVAIVAAVAAVLRLWNLGRPGTLVFDETYYVKQAWTLLQVGYEADWPEEPNPAFEAGDVNSFLPTADYVVHPPLGKWMIALGMKAFGGAENPWSWRIASAVVGVVAVVLVARIARRLFASTAMGIVAGALMAVDGEAIVHSRTGLLDNMLMIWVLVAFGCLLLDREQARRRLADRCGAILDAGGKIGRYGPGLGWRWWRFAAAVALGLACGVKWSGLYFLAVFAVVSVLWDATARRTAGVGRWWEDALVRDAIPAALIMLPTAALAYLGAWTSWFRTPGAYMRQWALDHPDEGVQWLPPALRSLWEYHLKMWDFHNGLTSEHTYEAHPLGWILQWRPTSFYWRSYDPGEAGCEVERCARAITSLGNPVLWWTAALAILVALYALVRLKDWRALAVLSGVVAGWAPWFLYAERTIFTFYSIVFTPWVVLTLVYAMTLALERTEHRPVARARVKVVLTVLLTTIGAVSVFFYPIWTAWQVPYWFWRLHMWLPTWI